jgi:hypothetical protein
VTTAGEATPSGIYQGMDPFFVLLRVAPYELDWVALCCLRDAEAEVVEEEGEFRTALRCPGCSRTAEVSPAEVREAWNEAMARQVR